ncbi:MAG: manganese-dependent inorganic pyrophosphatase [Patescibacteria group bacterium]|nr:manganese-dependent inorganic pyrophosphatase [Patescibacteria group bacterium]
MKRITILGHKNPDTDAVFSAIALAELFNKTEQYKATAKIANTPNKETAYALKRFKIKTPTKLKPRKGETLFLVDFNEEEQSPVPFKNIEIEGIVDHHKLNIKIEKDSPAIFRIEPLGSSCSIVAKMYRDYRIKINKKIASILLSGIISDTLKLSSPTTTKEDKQIANELAKIAGIETDELATKMFEAKSSLDKLSPKKIITTDYKEYQFKQQKTGIGVLETIDPSSAFKKEREIRRTLSEYKKKHHLDFIFFGIVNILEHSTSFLLIGKEEEELVAKAFGRRKIKDGIATLPGVTSRKKQIVPALMQILK